MGNTNSNFNYKEYLYKYPDLIPAGINTHEKALNHFINHGKKEGRTCTPLNFDWIQYLQNYPDLTSAGIDTRDKALNHFINHGKKERRLCTPLKTIINNISILNRLLNFNITNKKLQYDYTNIDINKIYVPPYGVLLKIKNNNISILRENKGTFFPDQVYNDRFIPFYNYLKKLDISNINLLCIFIYSDTILKNNNSLIDLDLVNNIININLPICVSSMNINLYKIAKNVFLIPNFYTYSNNIPINKVIDDDIQFDLKTNKAMGAFSNTSQNRVQLKKWSIGKQKIEIKLKSLFYSIPGLTNKDDTTIKEQLNYKYLISMDGCVTSWNGLIWKMYSNSLVIKEKTNCIEYWYFLLNNNNIIEFELNNMDKIINIVDNNYKNDNMLKEQQNIAKIITSEETTNTYLIDLFRKLSN